MKIEIIVSQIGFLGFIVSVMKDLLCMFSCFIVLQTIKSFQFNPELGLLFICVKASAAMLN